MTQRATLHAGGSAAVLAAAPADGTADAAPAGAAAAAHSTSRHRELVIGRLTEICKDGTAVVVVRTGSGDERCRALSTVPFTAGDVGRSVALAFLDGDAARPIVLGLIAESTALHLPASQPSAAAMAVTVDDDRLTLCAEREIVLRCGRASVTLTRAGKILIRGAYLLSRSSGANRIKGASVQIN